jgi:hypothetical protein
MKQKTLIEIPPYYIDTLIGALQGYVIVALQGCVIVALQGCVIVALQLKGCVIVVLQGCVIFFSNLDFLRVTFNPATVQRHSMHQQCLPLINYPKGLLFYIFSRFIWGPEMRNN